MKVLALPCSVLQEPTAGEAVGSRVGERLLGQLLLRGLPGKNSIYRWQYLAACSVLIVGAGRAEVPFDFDSTPGSLSKTVVPYAYRIDITPNLAKLTLLGHESIDVKVRVATAVIQINQAGLTLQSATLETGAAADITQDDRLQTATLKFARPVATGSHTLTIVYRGPILDSPHGIYFSDYKNADGESKRMLATQFEATDARRMFPCWDEPAFKATFQLSATLPTALAVVSNMPIVITTPMGPDIKHVVFANSPRMSSYLLTLLTGDLSSVDRQTAGINISAWAPSGSESRVQYGLDVAQQILPYYNSYFGVPYPLPKLDLIAVPGNDVAAGAMENAGAITFVGNALFFDAEKSSAVSREELFLTVAHELAHQWSGYLVTMGWWDDIWLNEGVATWMQNKASDHFHPDWESWQRQHADREQAMSLDAGPNAAPIQRTMRDDSEASSAFDSMSYQKESQLIRMVEDWIGPDAFQNGLREYTRMHAYSNATSADLWLAFGAAAHRDVAQVGRSFTEQPGLPVVQMTRSCSESGASITLTQARFSIHDPSAKSETWNIPITFGQPGEPLEHVVLARSPLTFPIPACDTPIKLNLGENGYFRTQYDEMSFKALAGVLPDLQAVDRANLLGDQFALFVAKRGPLADYLDLLNRLKDEQKVVVWQDTLSHLKELHRLLQGSAEQDSFDAYAIGLIRPEFARLGWDAKPAEAFVEALLRPELIAALGQLGDAEVIAEARRRFNVFIAAPASLPAGLRTAVLGIVGHNADQVAYDSLSQLAAHAAGTEEKFRYLAALAAAADPALIRRNVTLSGSGKLPNERIADFIDSVSRASGESDFLYSLAAPIAHDLDTRIPGNGFQPTVLMAAAAGSFNPEIAKALLTAPSSRTSSNVRRQAARVAAEITGNAELRARATREARSWMAGRIHTTSAETPAARAN